MSSMFCEHSWVVYNRIFRHDNINPTYGEMYRNCPLCNVWQVGGEIGGRETWVSCTRPVVEIVIYDPSMKR